VGDDDDDDDDDDNNNNNKSVSSAEAKSWRPQILRRSRNRQSCDKMADRQSCDKMADNTGHELLSTKNVKSHPTI
jgi:hypothetical protein